MRLNDAIVRHTRNRTYVLAVFLDFERAFDMVWRRGLLIKLKKFGINGRMFDWFDSFMDERTFQVRIGLALSEIHKLENGTAQGSTISPNSFLYTIDDLADSLQDVESSLFADDRQIFQGGRNLKAITKSVQRVLDTIAEWSDT